MERTSRAWMLAAGAGVAGALWVATAQVYRPPLVRDFHGAPSHDASSKNEFAARPRPSFLPREALDRVGRLDANIGERHADAPSAPLDEERYSGTFAGREPTSPAAPGAMTSFATERAALTSARIAPTRSNETSEPDGDSSLRLEQPGRATPTPPSSTPRDMSDQAIEAVEPPALFEADETAETLAAPIPEIEFSGPRMASIEAEALENIRHGLRLGDRRAYFAARSHFVAALSGLTRAFDAQTGTSASDPDSFGGSLAAALTALDELNDFSPRDDALDAEIDLTAIVESHRTGVLKGRTVVNGIDAARAYLDFAVARFARAGGRSRVASQALYGLGRAHMALRHDTEQNARVHAAKAMACQQAALRIDPENHLASNELGVLYAEFKQFEFAKTMLLKSVASSSQPTAWQNLAAVHELLGEGRLAQLARRERDIAAQSAGRASAPGAIEDRLVWVPPEQFGGAISQAPSTAQKAPRGRPTGPTRR